MTTTVELENVRKHYGAIEAVRDVSFELPPGEVVALIGHNGAGKTTLFKLMLGLVHPSAGALRVLDENPAEGEFAARRRLGYLPESVSFNPALTGQEILTFYARLKREPIDKALALLDQVGLGVAASRRVGTYSKGMRQRLGLAQALIGDPRLLLLDEPTTGLDPELRATFYRIIRERRDRGTTAILSSHALTEVEESADRVIILNRGLMLANGSIDDLRRLAQLPAKMRVTVANGDATAVLSWLGPVGNWRQIDGRTVEFEAPSDMKVELLRRATREGTPIRDLDMESPSLDALYAHFLGEQKAAQ